MRLIHYGAGCMGVKPIPTYLAEANVGHLKLVLVEYSPETAIKQLHSTTQRALTCVCVWGRGGGGTAT